MVNYILKTGTSFTNPKTGTAFKMLHAPKPGKLSLKLQRVVKPNTGRTLPHVHMDFVKRFMIERNRTSTKLNRRPVEFEPTKTMNIPPKHSHINPWNTKAKNLVMQHTFKPTSDFVLTYVKTLKHLMTENRTDQQKKTPLSVTFTVTHHTRSQTFTDKLPHAPQTALLTPIGAQLAKLHSYTLHLP